MKFILERIGTELKYFFVADSSHEFGHRYAMNGEVVLLMLKEDDDVTFSLVGNKDLYWYKNGLDTYIGKESP